MYKIIESNNLMEIVNIMKIINEFKDITIKKNEMEVGSFTSKVIMKSKDGSIEISVSDSCVITGNNVDDSVAIISVNNSISVTDQDANTININLTTIDQLTQASTLINNGCNTNGVSVRSKVTNAGGNPAYLTLYSTKNSSSSITLGGDVTLLGELGLSAGTTNGVNDNSIDFSSSSSGKIGESEDGSYMDGAIGVYTPDILTPSTPVGHAIDWINEYLGMLTPHDNGVSLDNSDLSLDGISFETGYLSDDLSGSSVIHYGGSQTSGILSLRVLTRSQVSDIIHLITIPFKNADKGTIEIELNGSSLGQFNLEFPFDENLRSGNQNVTIPGYDASGQEMDVISVGMYDDFPLYQEAVIQLFDSNASAILQNGYNLIKAIHTIGVDIRNTNDFEFFFNNTSDAPSVNAGSISILKGAGITTRQMSGITLINGGDDDISSPTYDNMAKYAYNNELFSINGDVFDTTSVLYNDTSLIGQSSPIEYQDVIGFASKTTLLKTNIVYYDAPTLNIVAGNLVSTLTSSDIDTDKWIVDTNSPGNSSDIVENFNDETRRMYYGTPYEGSVTSISGLDIIDTGSDFTGMVGFWIKNTVNDDYAKITAVSGDTATLDVNNFIVGNTFEVYVTGSLMLLSDKGNFNSSATLVGRSYKYLALGDMTEALALLSRVTRPSINFSVSHFPLGSPSYVSLDGKYATYITYFRTSGVRTGMKLVFEGFGSIANFQAFMQEIRITIPFDDSANAGYNGTAFNPSTSNKPALYRGLLYKADGSGQYDSGAGNPTTGSGIRLGEPTLNGSDVEIDFTTGTLTNLNADLNYFVELIVKGNAPVFSLTNSILTKVRMEER